MKSGVERRRARRRSVMGTFSLFAVIPKKGVHRLDIQDISDLGMSFDLDVEGESSKDFPVAPGEIVGLRFYLNQSLYLPLDVRIVRLEQTPQGRRAGGEFSDHASKGYKAFLSFLKLMDEVLEIAQIDPQA